MVKQENKAIDVNIEPLDANEKDKVKLIFRFEKPIELSLSTESQSSLKSFFVSLLQRIDGSHVKFDFKGKNDNNLFISTAEKYIDILNSEIIKLFSDFPNKEEYSVKLDKNIFILSI